MRHTRSKQIRKTLQFYERIIPGFPRTATTTSTVTASSSSSVSTSASHHYYHILLDGTFIVHSYKYHVPFVERIYKLLGLRWYDDKNDDRRNHDDVDNKNNDHKDRKHHHHHPVKSAPSAPRNHNKKRIQFYVCQSTITELQTIQSTMRQQKKEAALKKKLKKKKSTKHEEIEDDHHDGISSSNNNKNLSDDVDDDDYLQRAIDFCIPPPVHPRRNNTEEQDRMSVIILPARNDISLNNTDGDNVKKDALKDATSLSHISPHSKPSTEGGRRRSTPLSLSSIATSDLWYYLSSSAARDSGGTGTEHLIQPPPPHYMIATQDPTLLYYCRHQHTHHYDSPPNTAVTSTTSNQLVLPIPIIRYNIPVIATTTTNNYNNHRSHNGNDTKKTPKGCGVLVLDPPSTQYMKQYQYMEHGKWFHSTAETTTTTGLNATASTVVPSSKTALSHRKSGTSSDRPPKGSQRYLQTKKAKGPNPLSCKKKKASTPSLSSSSKRQRTT